jgi:hypothetical protein
MTHLSERPCMQEFLLLDKNAFLVLRVRTGESPLPACDPQAQLSSELPSLGNYAWV